MSGGTGLNPRTAAPFPVLANDLVRDTQMRANVRHATDVIQAKRARVVGEMTDWQELREAGKRIREYAIAHMDTLLEDFERNCRGAGGVVHWARDAAEARGIVVALAREAVCARGNGSADPRARSRNGSRDDAGGRRSCGRSDARRGPQDQIHDNGGDPTEPRLGSGWHSPVRNGSCRAHPSAGQG